VKKVSASGYRCANAGSENLGCVQVNDRVDAVTRAPLDRAISS
jgi:hypothetical protein